MDKLTKSRVLQDGVGPVLRGLKGWGWDKKIFSIMWGLGKTKPFGVGAKTPSFRPVSPHCHPYLLKVESFSFFLWVHLRKSGFTMSSLKVQSLMCHNNKSMFCFLFFAFFFFFFLFAVSPKF